MRIIPTFGEVLWTLFQASAYFLMGWTWRGG